jgi:hypothetical protein
MIEKEYKTKNTQESYVNKAREKYESDCVRINSYTAQSTLMQGRDLDRITAKLERAQQTVQNNEKDFANFSRALHDTVQKWEQDWKAFCDACQDMEDERMEFMKDNMWAFANAVSTVCVADDEASCTIFILTPTRSLTSISLARKFGLPSSSSSLRRIWKILFVITVLGTQCSIPQNLSTTRIRTPYQPPPHGQRLALLTSLVLQTVPIIPAQISFLRPRKNRFQTTTSLV